jgi:ribonuclease E
VVVAESAPEAAAADESVPEAGAAAVAAAEATPPRRRTRRATRPAAAADPVAEPEVPAIPAEATDPVLDALAATKPVRKRASRRKTAEPAADVADALAELTAAVAATVEAPVTEDSTVVAIPDVDLAGAVEGEGAKAETIVDDVSEIAAEDDLGEVVADASGSDAAEDDVEVAELDEVAAALAAAVLERNARAGAVPASDDEADALSTEEALDSLADAISLDEEETSGEEGGDDDSSAAATGARRRRRRGGRRRRRGGSDAPAAEETDEDDEQSADDAAASEGDVTGETSAEADSEDSDETSGTRRRRRRRRRGDSADAGDESGRTVRTTAEAAEEVTGIVGSTRMEAKRQRRKEGRAAGRRRSPMLSEAEFLARRESVSRRMLIRQHPEYIQLAVLEDDMLVEHYVDRPSATSLIGNIYLGRVQNVLPSMEAAFIDIGRGRNAVLYAGEVDWDSFGADGEFKKIERVFKSGQSVLVQVTKDPIGAKGARLTSHISLPGRFIVYSPGGHLSGISRKLPVQERERLKTLLGQHISDEASFIVRTAAEGADEDDLVRDVNRLQAQWEIIDKAASRGPAPKLLYAEPDLTLRIVRDLFTEDFSEVLIEGTGDADDAFDAVDAYVKHVAPNLADRVHRWEGEPDTIFAKNRVDEQISKALERKVFLPSGGSLIIDRTEAMTVIDVNTGKFTGSGGNLEATVTSNNLEAAEEIVRQLRLRDIGGIIVVDFIDMVLPSNRELLLRRLVECLGRDRTRHQVSEVTSLGLVQMTRKRLGTGLAEAFTVPCETCQGRGYHRHDQPITDQAPADGGERHRGRGKGQGSNQGKGGHKSSHKDSTKDSSHKDASHKDKVAGASEVVAQPV